MTEIVFKEGPLREDEHDIVMRGFTEHAWEQAAPLFEKRHLNWTARVDDNLRGALTGDVLWDWLYVDELWVAPEVRGSGLGARLLSSAEDHARDRGLTGVWLWTQSWQAAGFYSRCGFEEFARFPDFPKGCERIGFRKVIAA